MQLSIKNRLLGCCGVILAAGLALPAQAEGAVEMITYFPVAYARYNNLYMSPIVKAGGHIGPQLEIGTAFDKTFELNIGQQGFQAKTVNLSSGRLQIMNDFSTDTATFGSGEGSTDPAITFLDLYLKDIKKGTGSIDSVTLDTQKPITLTANQFSKFTLFGKQLPSSGNGCDGKVRWRKYSGKCYLVCCPAADPNCSSLTKCGTTSGGSQGGSQGGGQGGGSGYGSGDDWGTGGSGYGSGDDWGTGGSGSGSGGSGYGSN